MTFTGKWAFNWLDMTWGPFDSKEEGERILQRLQKYPNVPEATLVFPLWDISFIDEIASKYDGN